jgi:D-alanine-D-alanine ligase
MTKIKIGIFFGGLSREREVSFAGGRTVYDNLNKEIFEPVPIFVDSFNQFVLLKWEHIYKGSIRDFYPPVQFIPENSLPVQIYAESIGVKHAKAMAEEIGHLIVADDLKNYFDIAFLCLHGADGEDGRIQGLLEFYGIPYSGSGIYASSFGMNKATQKSMMQAMKFEIPDFITIPFNSLQYLEEIYQKVLSKIKGKKVIKPANQGSSVGVSILQKNNFEEFKKAVEKAFFIRRIEIANFKQLSKIDKLNFLKHTADIREGLGFPLYANHQEIYTPDALLDCLENSTENEVLLRAFDGEHEILVEAFVEGKEFSCIVIENDKNQPIALAPTEIIKSNVFFDYRSKYLPGLSRKITPIQLPHNEIISIRRACEQLYTSFKFEVYARIDGFITKTGNIFLNDPNTTSGMMPSSFFFHQAAEIGLNPSQFITFIIETSLRKRIKYDRNSPKIENLSKQLEKLIQAAKNHSNEKIKVAVVLGGYSAERHISVESGRNVYEKLSSSEKYNPIPVFLSGNANGHSLHIIPINILLKDNADDIKEKIQHFSVHPAILEIIEECKNITLKYGKAIEAPKLIDYQMLSKLVDEVFIALHGRPGEDGEVQEELEKLGLPFNGSRKESASITIDKYKTNEILHQHGFKVAQHLLVTQNDFEYEKQNVFENISNKIGYPLIAKPVDDGCSAAVKKINSKEDLENYLKIIFRGRAEINEQEIELLKLKPGEEFPNKNQVLIESLIQSEGAAHFIEITGGMVTKFENDEIVYEVFEASEALSVGEVLSLEEKFLAGEGQNITPARYAFNQEDRQKISNNVKLQLGAAAKVLKVEGYCRIDAFVRIYSPDRVEVIFIEVNSLPGMTPATCIFHQSAINGYKPVEFIDKILEFGKERTKKTKKA